MKLVKTVSLQTNEAKTHWIGVAGNRKVRFTEAAIAKANLDAMKNLGDFDTTPEMEALTEKSIVLSNEIKQLIIQLSSLIRAKDSIDDEIKNNFIEKEVDAAKTTPEYLSSEEADDFETQRKIINAAQVRGLKKIK